MKTLLAFVLCLIATLGHAANPSTKSFRGTGGIGIMSNDITGVITIDGSGIFTSSGTNATIATSTNGVLIAAASTNINFTPGNNVVIKGTNASSSSHINIGISSNLSFFAAGNEMVLGNWAGVFGLSNVALNEFAWSIDDPAAGSDVIFGGLISAVNANFSLLAGTGDMVSISPGGTLGRTNFGDALNVFLLTDILPVIVVDSLTATNLVSNPPFFSVQYNSNGVTRGSPRFLFTNNTIRLDQMPTNGSPIAFVAVDENGVFYETATPSGGAGSVAAPISSVQFNSNGVLQGSANFVFTNGLVGIGTGVPLMPLHIRSTVADNSRMRFEETGDTASTHYSGFGYYDAGTFKGGVFKQGDTHNILFFDATSARLTVEQGGDVGIGAVPVNRLDVEGAMAVGASYSGSSTAPANGMIVEGQVGIGTNVPADRFQVTASGTTTNVVRFGTIALPDLLQLRTNGTLRLSNLSSNASPIALLATDAAGDVYETAITVSSFSVSGQSNQIPYLDVAGTGFIFGSSNRVAPGFGFTRRGAHPALMIHEDLTNTYSLVAIGPPGYASDITSFTPSLVISNRYAYSGSGNKHTQEMVRVTFVDVTDGSDPESFIQTWRYSDGSGGSTISASVRKDGLFAHAHGTLYPSNALSSTMPTAAMIGPGGVWVGNSNTALVAIKSANGTTTAMTVLVP